MRVSELDSSSSSTREHRKMAGDFFTYLCWSSAIRSLEVGLVGAMFPAIQAALDLDRGTSTLVALAPDIGLVPVGLVAVFLFQRVPAKLFLVAGDVVFAGLGLWCAVSPSLWSLVLARAGGAFFWGLAAVLIPTWVDSHAPDPSCTVWLALYHAMLLIGLLAGYALGGAAEHLGSRGWTSLYGLDAGLMLISALGAASFPKLLVQVSPGVLSGPLVALKQRDLPAPSKPGVGRVQVLGEEDLQTEQHPVSPSERGPTSAHPCRRLLGSGLYLALVGGMASAAGLVYLFHFFLSRVSTAVGLSPRVSYPTLGFIFVSASLPGTLLGALVVARAAGGYTHRRPTCLLVARCAVATLLCALLLPLASFGLCDAQGRTDMPVFIAGAYGALFLGAAPTASFVGLAVSVVPDTATHASSVQFFAQTLVKLLVPTLGDLAIQHLGLLGGFEAVVVGASLALVASALAALRHISNNSTEPRAGGTSTLVQQEGQVVGERGPLLRAKPPPFESHAV